MHLLTVRGRKSGLPRTTPVNLIEYQGRRWLVAPYREVAWVRNVRAAGEVESRSVCRFRSLHRYRVELRRARFHAGPAVFFC